uniref:ATP synthase complex subunit 8 n=1 Tax=Tigridemyia acanthofemurilis TaxID=2980482 RepID=A0A977LJY2_9MUSC|nr:ATP synthase F0 subunit 8 [Tigridemyia acanthofemurilis]QVL28830.1 ATP synthase F0 subunit 8 [Mallota vilis]UXG18967.1 ATP synthase F0 subunit 8 [Tigridemyia acanthofemurilis]
MPQMAPINWLSLFLLFLIIFMLFNVLNYFHYSPQMPKSEFSDKITTKSMNWKW